MKKHVSFSNNIKVFEYNKNEPIQKIRNIKKLSYGDKKYIGFIPILIFYFLIILLLLLLRNIF